MREHSTARSVNNIYRDTLIIKELIEKLIRIKHPGVIKRSISLIRMDFSLS